MHNFAAIRSKAKNTLLLLNKILFLKQEWEDWRAVVITLTIQAVPITYEKINFFPTNVSYPCTEIW
jgi:hypothetical protein